ncbi:hypothetical protein DL93DRAFT_2167259 [Clavulina sp. PMI_390]|nr:hypothetical protein DL93DRAFT_2167259 [Clavulina sp. PMI_390]
MHSSKDEVSGSKQSSVLAGNVSRHQTRDSDRNNSSSLSSRVDPSQRASSVDERRNLYVLGIPHHMTLEELKERFGRHGAVKHAVILAVLDAFRRRRGFIVMNSNAEAAIAMKALSGTVIMGHKLHVSWAVVQRSNGFLDGVDRSVTAPPGTSSDSPSWAVQDNAFPPAGPHYERPRPIKIPPALSLSSHRSNSLRRNALSTTLVLRNLHREIFKNASNVLPLLEPFGTIQRIRLIAPKEDHSGDTTSTSKNNGSSSPILTPTEENPNPTQNFEDGHLDTEQSSEHVGAIVEFANPQEVSAAVSALHGQVYGDISIEAERGAVSPISETPDEDEDELDGDVSSGDSLADEVIQYRPRRPAFTKRRSAFVPPGPPSPFYGAFPSAYLGSPTLFTFPGGFPLGHPWMSSYSAPPSPAQLAQFYFAQENHPELRGQIPSPRYAGFPFPYPTETSRHLDSRPYFPRTSSQQY